jgi:hypothetical protein
MISTGKINQYTKIKMYLKSTLVIALLLIFAISFSANAQSDVATARATIVAPISLKKTADLEFGNIAAGTSAGTVEIPAAPGTIVRLSGGGVSLFTIEGTVSAACFKVSGTLLQSYSVVLPTSVELILNGDATTKMTADEFTSNLTDNKGIITLENENASTNNIYVGATLHVGASQEAGIYESTPFEVTVAYN